MTSVQFLFEALDIRLSIPKTPMFSEMSYSVVIERLGKPETRHQTRWESPATAIEEKTLGTPIHAWTPNETSDEASDDTDNDATSAPGKTAVKAGAAAATAAANSGAEEVATISWSPMNYVGFVATLTTTSDGAGFHSKRAHPFSVSVQVSPRHPSMGITPKCTSTRTWMPIVQTNLAVVASLHLSNFQYCLSTARKNDPTASASIIPGVKLVMALKATQVPETFVPRPPWAGCDSRFPYVFLFDQLIMTRRAVGGHSGVVEVMDNIDVRVELERKRSDGPLRIAKKVVIPLDCTPFDKMIDVDDVHYVRTLSMNELKALELDFIVTKRITNGAPREALSGTRTDARSDSSLFAVLDSVIPSQWTSAVQPYEGGLRVFTLPLETSPELGQIIPRQSKRTQLSFSFRPAVVGGRTAPGAGRQQDDRDAGWIDANGVPLDCSSRLYGFENFPEQGLIFFHEFPDLCELRYRVRRLRIVQYADCVCSERVLCREDVLDALAGRGQ